MFVKKALILVSAEMVCYGFENDSFDNKTLLLCSA